MSDHAAQSSVRKVIVLVVSAIFCATCASSGESFVIRTEKIVSGLARPVFLTAPPGDTTRLFIVEQHTAQVKIVKGRTVLATPFLNIDNVVIDTGSERGLLGLAFHPLYETNGYFYVNYTNNDGDTVIARFSVSDNPDRADPNSSVVVLTIPQPFANHNGGMLAFGPNDGYLYIGMGDGGSAGDPGNRAQDDGELLGKMLRIDVDGPLPYGIPPDNPPFGEGDPPNEIWAKGFRNPWRFSFDRGNGDLFMADVGQNTYEEIDFQPATSTGGENYGWSLMEGSHCFNPPGDCDPGGLTYPIHEYTHAGNPFRCSVTGGYVYRGNAIPDLQGTYFFADFCSDQIWSFRYDGATLTELTDRTNELAPGNGLSIENISSFGEDGTGELYILDLNGEVFKVCPEEGCPVMCEGNFDCDEDVDAEDVTEFLNHFGRGQYFNPCTNPDPCGGDFTCDGDVDADDVTTFLEDFGRGRYFNPCPLCDGESWCVY
jgi:glucose/arabinose dehydrogenase